MIEININSLPLKIQNRFPQDPKYDVAIKFKQRTYQLQQAYLRVQSKFFREKLSKGTKQLEIHEEFQSSHFCNVLSSFYGFSLKISRKDSLCYFQIIKYLSIIKLYQVFTNDLTKNLGEYDFFQVLDVSYRYNQQSIFEICLQQLKQKKFAQIKQYRNSLLKTTLSIFKLVIKGYNKESKAINQLTPYDIQELIQQYCRVQKLDYTHSSSLKLELIDKNNLTAFQYRDIFLMDKQMMRNYQENINKKKSKLLQRHSLETPNTNSAITEWRLSQRSLVLGMETTFQQKIQSQLKKNQKILLHQIKQIKKQYQKQECKGQNMKNNLTQIYNKAKQGMENKIITQKIIKINKKLQNFQTLMTSTDFKLKNLIEKSEEVMAKYPAKQKTMMQMSIVNSQQSMHLNARQFVTPQTSNQYQYHNPKKNNSMKDDKNHKQERKADKKMMKKPNPAIQIINNQNIWESESHLGFNIKPLTIKTQKELSILANLIAPDRFIYKSLNLILRRSQNSANIGVSLDLKCRNELLILFRTDKNKLAGGKISVQIPILAEDYVQDPHAFIFSATENKKFRIKKKQRDEAIMITDGYIICFNTDLMISEKCLQNDNYCSWPNVYEQNKEYKNNNPQWLVGDQQFRITELECYQIDSYSSRQMII